MKANDRARLTTALRDHVAKIAADLRAKMRAPGDTRMAAERLHKDERVAEDFEVWTDLLSRRAAVLWVLKSVYVRVLEDRGLLAPGRLLDPEAQQLFEKLAPNLGETAFLRWIYKDLASSRGGVPELFSPQPAEVALPSDELSRALIAFWRHRDADSGAVWSFAEEKFEGELMGDLYQELDPVVKDRFALCQTPDFVRAFILDRTLTPAIETFGADEVRLLDPACGSGHFLIDGLKRLVAATAEQHADWDRAKVVAHALDRVVGVDLNDYACALARTRLIMTAAELAGVTRLSDAARFHPHVYWADGLEQVEKEAQKPTLQYALFEKVEDKPRATLTRSDVRAALKKVFEKKFHAVVANPPYIVESDESRRQYHREKVGRQQRYLSAYRLYSLGGPFTERAFQMCLADGFIGLITADSFMKRVSGKPLVEKVFKNVDLTLLVDTSKAEVLQRDSTTVLMFGRNRRPVSPTLRVVMGRRGEIAGALAPPNGQVWSSILSGWNTPGFENEFVTVADLPRRIFDKHPWSLSGGGAQAVLEQIEGRAELRLSNLAEEIGTTMKTGLDEAFVVSPAVARRWGPEATVPLMRGGSIRDWGTSPTERVIFPYDPNTLALKEPTDLTMVLRLWRAKPLLLGRLSYGDRADESGIEWFEWSMIFRDRFQAAQRIAFPVQATHNHFAFVTEDGAFNTKAPVIVLNDGIERCDAFACLGILNSSVMAFWMRQTFQPRGGQSTGKKRQSEEWSRRLEVDATKLKNAPLVLTAAPRLAAIAERLIKLVAEATAQSPAAILSTSWTPESIEVLLRDAKTALARIRARMIAAQEELDWATYAAFGLCDASLAPEANDLEELASEHRPFAIHLARRAQAGSVSFWFEAMGVTPALELPYGTCPRTTAIVNARIASIDTSAFLAVLEQPEFKRKWEPCDFDATASSALFEWLADKIEDALEARGRPASAPTLAALLQDDQRFLAVASIYQQRRDVDVASIVNEVLTTWAVANHPLHVFTATGLTKNAAWEQLWAMQRRRDLGEEVPDSAIPGEYSQGSRGKTTDFIRDEYWRLRGNLDFPGERFIVFTEAPGHAGAETLYGWAGWTAQQRIKAILAIDEDLEDSGVSLADRIGLLDSAWRLLPDVAREDAAAATRLKAELQALVGPEGPSRELIEDWKKRFPPPTKRPTRTRKAVATPEDEDESDVEEEDE